MLDYQSMAEMSVYIDEIRGRTRGRIRGRIRGRKIDSLQGASK